MKSDGYAKIFWIDARTNYIIRLDSSFILGLPESRTGVALSRVKEHCMDDKYSPKATIHLRQTTSFRHAKGILGQISDSNVIVT